MRKFTRVFLLAAVMLGGCFLQPNSEDAAQARRPGTEAPPVTTSDDQGRIAYVNPAPDPEFSNVKPPSFKCRVEDVTRSIPSDTVPTRLFDSLRAEVDFDRKVEGLGDLLDADYLHILHVDIEVVKGDTLDFVDWIRIYAVRGDQRSEVAWGADFTATKSTSLQVDGSLNLKPFIQDDGSSLLVGTVAAHSPSEDTLIGGSIRFRKFYDCKRE